MDQPPNDNHMPATDLNAPLECDDQQRWSFAAIAGFILSFLFLLAPAGIILGIIGIFRTRRRRRRGMGLAIAAIPIGVIISGVTAILVTSIWYFAQVAESGRKTLEVLRISRVDATKAATKQYANMSPRFRVSVPGERFEQWLTQTVTEHGALQSVKRGKKFIDRGEDDTIVLSFTGEFVNGPANIRIVVGANGLSPEIDDIEVDGQSPRGQK